MTQDPQRHGPDTASGAATPSQEAVPTGPASTAHAGKAGATAAAVLPGSPAEPGKKPLARLLEVAIRYSHVLSALLVLVGVLGFAALPAVKRGTHFDENALLAGSARPTLRCSGSPGGPAAACRGEGRGGVRSQAAAKLYTLSLHDCGTRPL